MAPTALNERQAEVPGPPKAVPLRNRTTYKTWQHIEEEKQTSADASALTFGAKQSAHPTSDRT